MRVLFSAVSFWDAILFFFFFFFLTASELVLIKKIPVASQRQASFSLEYSQIACLE